MNFKIWKWVFAKDYKSLNQKSGKQNSLSKFNKACFVVKMFIQVWQDYASINSFKLIWFTYLFDWDILSTLVFLFLCFITQLCVDILPICINAAATNFGVNNSFLLLRRMLPSASYSSENLLISTFSGTLCNVPH